MSFTLSLLFDLLRYRLRPPAGARCRIQSLAGWPRVTLLSRGRLAAFECIDGLRLKLNSLTFLLFQDCFQSIDYAGVPVDAIECTLLEILLCILSFSHRNARRRSRPKRRIAQSRSQAESCCSRSA